MRMLERSYSSPLATAAASCSRSTAYRPHRRQRLVLLRQRGRRPPRARPPPRPRGRPHLVGPARLERHRLDSRRGRLVSRAVPERDRGKRYPVTLECATDVGAACKRVSKAASAAVHVPPRPPAARHRLRPRHAGDRRRDVERAPVRGGAELIAYGPGASGVYARFSGPGADAELLDPAGHAVQNARNRCRARRRDGGQLLGRRPGWSPAPTWPASTPPPGRSRRSRCTTISPSPSTAPPRCRSRIQASQ